jgi:hypothetical protein
MQVIPGVLHALDVNHLGGDVVASLLQLQDLCRKSGAQPVTPRLLRRKRAKL